MHSCAYTGTIREDLMSVPCSQGWQSDNWKGSCWRKLKGHLHSNGWFFSVILVEQFYPWKAGVSSIGITEELMKIRSGKKRTLVILSACLKSDMFIDPAEFEPIYLVDI